MSKLVSSVKSAFCTRGNHLPLLTFIFVLGTFAMAGLAAAAEPAVASAGRHKVQVQDPAQAAQILAQGGRLVADYGSYQLFELPSAGVVVPGQSGNQSRDEYNMILLNAARLDTSKPEVQAMRQSVGAFAGKHLHLVQFAGPVQPEWREALVKAGVQIVTYIPQNAYLVYGDAQALNQVQTFAAVSPQVQWEGVFLDSYKIDPDAQPVDAQGQPRDIGTSDFAIQMVADPAPNAATLALIDLLKLEEVRRESRTLNYLNVVVALAPGSLARIAAQPEVVSIQPYHTPRKFDERQAQIVAGNLTGNIPSGPGYLAWLASKGFSQAQFTTSGFAVDVTDSGIDNGTTRPNHTGLFVGGSTAGASRVIYNRLEGRANPGSTLKGCDGHGTLNSHVIGGFDDLASFPHVDGANYHYGLGICPFVKLGSSVIFDPDSYTFPNFTTLQSAAYKDGVRVSNNSWGANRFGAYNINSQEYDALVRDAQPSNAPFPTDGNQEMVIVFANGNAGPTPQSVGAPASAKNVISVGAAENVQSFGVMDGCGVTDSEADSANDIISFSSRGPCADGRHKPEIMAPGTHVSGGVAQAANPDPTGTADPCFNGLGVCALINGLFFPDNQQLFTVSSGTSHAAPCVVGGCALLRQYFINNFGGTPSPAMTKAYLMNSARYMTGVSANDSLWSDNQGMGEMNLGTAFDGTRRILRDELTNDLFTASGQTRTFTGTVYDTNRAFRVTLAWTDAPGNTVGSAYNNNLDLTVTVGGNTYKGNVFNGALSDLGGAADDQNNSESVFLPPGVSGPLTVTVTATSINSDGVPNNAYPLDQGFALVMYNVQPPPPSITALSPTNLTVLVGQSAGFAVTASGAAPLSYQWRVNGAIIPGATASAYTIALAQLTNAGNYSVVVSDINGTSTSPNARLTVVATVPLAYALNNSNFVWTVNSASPWYGQTNLSHDGIASARSYFIGDGLKTTLRTSTNGPGTFTFWWKVSSQTNADVLGFSASSSVVTNSLQISGEVDWNQQTVYLPPGSQSLQWTYSKDSALSSGNDAGWVDQVSFVPGATPPFIVSQPADQSTLAAAPVTFTVGAAGTPLLTYQWRLNGVSIPGATASAYTIPSPSRTDAGAYSVQIANGYGGILSSNAYLQVVPLVVNGDNSLNQLKVSLSATNAIGVAAGAWHTLALRADGGVLAWGENYDGQCDVPADLVNAVAVAAGGYHSLALRADRTVVAWGANSSGQATPPAGLSNIKAVAAGSWHSLALRSNGTVVGWGDDSLGQTDVPAGLANVVAIAAGGNHSLALLVDGTVVAWGENTDASGAFAGQSTVPFGLSHVVSIAAGDYHSLAVKDDGSLVVWGDNSEGQSQPPTGLTGVVGAVGGGSHSVALKRDTMIVAWGNNWNGQCTFPATLTNVLALSAGNSHTRSTLYWNVECGASPGNRRS